MLVFESTEATSQTGLQEMLAHVQSSLYDFNIKPSTSNEQLCTRIGIVVYGLTSVLYAPLGSLSRDEFLAIDSLPYFGDQIPNLEDALRMASLQFQTQGDRSNARNVIVLMAASYYAGGVFGSGQIAAQFKEDNGVLVVYNYVEQHGFPELKLERLASPGYFLTNIEDNSSINRALCDGKHERFSSCAISRRFILVRKSFVHYEPKPQDMVRPKGPEARRGCAGCCEVSGFDLANCFCRLGYDAFDVDPLRYTPLAGCYSVKQASTSYQLAANQCRNEDGCVALAKQRNQTDYLEKKFTFGSSFWIGLKWDQFKQNYVWADGTELNGSAQPWASSSDHQNGIDCVRVVPQSAELVWTPVDCRDSFAYSCEVAPCDSQIFCTQDV
ncbi:hypothetical protein RB195_009859 [Necator americanus]|uniref:Lectin C-type domain protein n=1 Tax=Necator americanus TaxID=51031 RepID=A0ABR1CXP1_NECAM